MKFSFDESARNEITNFFLDALGEIGNVTMSLFGELNGIYSREQYKPLGVMIYKVAMYYDTDFKGTVLQQFSDWQSSESSLVAFANTLEASDNDSDDAYVAAEALEDNLQGLLVQLLNQQPEIVHVSQEAHLTKNLDEIFDELDQLVQQHSTSAEDLVNTYESKITSNGEDNQLYVNVGEILTAIFTSYKALFDVFKEGVGNLGQHLGEQGNLAAERSEADSAAMTANAATAGDSLREVSGLFDFD